MAIGASTKLSGYFRQPAISPPRMILTLITAGLADGGVLAQVEGGRCCRGSKGVSEVSKLLCRHHSPPLRER